MVIVPFPKNPKVALLDWDGTFCDSRKSIYEMNLVMAAFYGKKMPSYEVWLQAAHHSVESCMKHIGVTDDRESVNKFFNKLLVEQREAGFQNPLYPGTEELLRFFQKLGIPAVVISRHLHEHLRKDVAAHGLAHYFYEIIGEPRDANLEKDMVMKYVCDELGIFRTQAFYLGDTSHDMKLARKAGVCAVAVSHGYDPVRKLSEEQPAHIFESLFEFQEFLTRVNQ